MKAPNYNQFSVSLINYEWSQSSFWNSNVSIYPCHSWPTDLHQSPYGILIEGWHANAILRPNACYRTTICYCIYSDFVRYLCCLTCHVIYNIYHNINASLHDSQKKCWLHSHRDGKSVRQRGCVSSIAVLLLFRTFEIAVQSW